MNITFKDVQLSFREYATTSLTYAFKSRPVLWVLLIPVLMGFVCWGFVLLGPLPAMEAIGVLSWQLWFFTLFSIGLPYSFWRNYQKSYYSSQFLQVPTTYTFTDESIQMESSVMQAQFSWQTAGELYQLAPYAFLMSSNLTAYILDFRCLQAPATAQDFMALLARHAITVK